MRLEKRVLISSSAVEQSPIRTQFDQWMMWTYTGIKRITLDLELSLEKKDLSFFHTWWSLCHIDPLFLCVLLQSALLGGCRHELPSHFWAWLKLPALGFKLRWKGTIYTNEYFGMNRGRFHEMYRFLSNRAVMSVTSMLELLFMFLLKSYNTSVFYPRATRNINALASD